jgi:CcmD family protein
MSYLFSAYAVVWIALFAYILSISSHQKKLDREMETLKKLIEQKQKK